MRGKIKIKLDIDQSVSEPEVIIRAKEETPLVREIVESIQKRTGKNERMPIEVIRNSFTTCIEQKDIIRVFSENRRIVAWTREGGFQTRCTLRELEETLDEEWFVRISRFEIVNLNYVSNFDMSIKGTMKVSFNDGSYSWVSRRFVIPVQKRLEFLARKGEESYE